MSKEIIRAKIDKKGNIEIETKGIKGKTCIEATADLEAYLGKQIGEKEFTTDYYKKPEPSNKSWITRK